jgi:peptidoglycan/xylan/chitin deacetylase (PgdA/CDA1 family)
VKTLADPVLRKYGFHSTIFAATGIVGTRIPAWADFLFCSFQSTKQQSVDYGGIEYSLSTPENRSISYYKIDARLKVLANGEREKAVASLLAALGTVELGADHPFMPLSWEELDILALSNNFNIASHTHAHPILSRCNAERQHDELQHSKEILSARYGEIKMLAYPNGRRCDFTQTTINAARDAGYNSALSTIEGLWDRKSDIFSIPRINVGAQTKIETFRMLLVGL